MLTLSVHCRPLNSGLPLKDMSVIALVKRYIELQVQNIRPPIIISMLVKVQSSS